jgi:hypothetical protein
VQNLAWAVTESKSEHEPKFWPQQAIISEKSIDWNSMLQIALLQATQFSEV